MLATVLHRTPGYTGGMVLGDGTVLTFTNGQAGPTTITFADAQSLTVMGYAVVTTDTPSTGYDLFTDQLMAPVITSTASNTSAALRAAYGLSVVSTVSASAALAVGKFTPVDATAAARTMTLPAGAGDGVTIGVGKVDATANVVSVTGNIRGVGSSTITLPWQHETLLLRADSAGSWWPVAGHKTKASIQTFADGRYTRGRSGQARVHIEHPQDLYAPWFQAGGNPAGVAANGAMFLRWVAPRDTVIYGAEVNVTTTSGNVDFGVFDSSWNKLASTGSIACPATGIQALNLAAGGVAVQAGRSYYLVLAGDNSTYRVAGWAVTNNVVGAHLVGGTFSGGTSVFPLPTSILTMAAGMTIGTPNSGPIMVPMLAPPLTAFPPTPLTMSIQSGSGQVYCVDPNTGRLFGSTGNGMAYSDDQGATWTTSGFNRSNPIQAMVISGTNLLIGTGTAATPTVGAIDKLALAGPYTNAAAVTVLSSQEGQVRPWNFVAYSDGTVFAGNYDSAGNGASQVRIRKSTDGGNTWSVVLDLGPADGSLRHVHSVIRDPNNSSIVWANIGDSGALCGVYKSTDGGNTFTRVSAFGSIRLTPVVPVSDGFLWLSDQYRMGGDLFWMDSAGTKLQPRSPLDSPWNGDGYGMTLTKDANGWLFYLLRFTNTSYTRSAVFVTPDEGVTSYLVADLGPTASYALSLLRVGNYLYCEGKRYDVSGLILD